MDMYRPAHRNHADILKCRQCREDKRKCTPINRSWPERCIPCIKFNHLCSIGLNAKDQKNSNSQRELLQARGDAFTNSSLPEYGSLLFEDITLSQPQQQTGDQDTFPVVPLSQVSILLEPTNYRTNDGITYLLRTRLKMLWGQQRTYDGICSRRFGNTLADMLIYTIQQIAETDDMVNSALYAFCAADSIISNKDNEARTKFTNLDIKHNGKALQKLLNRLRNKWPDCDRADFMPIMSTLFIMATHGICANLPEQIKIMSGLLEMGQSRSGAFLLNLKFTQLLQNGWRLQIYLADDKGDQGLICGHDTTLFDIARDMFIKTTVNITATSNIIEELEN